MDEPEEPPEDARFWPVLLYVLGFMLVLALLAFAAACLLRRLL